MTNTPDFIRIYQHPEHYFWIATSLKKVGPVLDVIGEETFDSRMAASFHAFTNANAKKGHTRIQWFDLSNTKLRDVSA